MRIGRMRLPPLSNVYEMAGKIPASSPSVLLVVEKLNIEILEKTDSNSFREEETKVWCESDTICPLVWEDLLYDAIVFIY